MDYSFVATVYYVCLFTSSVMLCIVAKRCVLEQKLLLIYSRRIWKIDWYQNE